MVLLSLVSAVNPTFFLALWVRVRLRPLRLGATALRRQDRDGRRVWGMMDVAGMLYCCRLFDSFVGISRLVVVCLNWAESGVELGTWVRFSMEWLGRLN